MIISWNFGDKTFHKGKVYKIINLLRIKDFELIQKTTRQYISLYAPSTIEWFGYIYIYNIFIVEHFTSTYESC